MIILYIAAEQQRYATQNIDRDVNLSFSVGLIKSEVGISLGKTIIPINSSERFRGCLLGLAAGGADIHRLILQDTCGYVYC